MEIRKNGEVIPMTCTVSQVVTAEAGGTIELTDGDKVLAVFTQSAVRLTDEADVESGSRRKGWHPVVTVMALAVALFAIGVALLSLSTIRLIETEEVTREPVPVIEPYSVDHMSYLTSEVLASVAEPEAEPEHDVAPAEVVEQPSEPEVVEPSEPALYNVPLSDDLQNYIRSKCVTDERTKLILAMIGIESSFNPSAVSSTNDYGLMQINTINHKWLRETLGITDFLDPYQSIDAGTYMINELMDENNDNVHLALMAYNMGRTGAKKCWNQGIYSSEYSRKIVNAMNALEEK